MLLIRVGLLDHELVRLRACRRQAFELTTSPLMSFQALLSLKAFGVWYLKVVS